MRSYSLLGGTMDAVRQHKLLELQEVKELR